jgi:alkaline phosphatase D
MPSVLNTLVRARPVTAGPIVGHTTPSSARLWGRGAFERQGSAVRRCHGVVEVRRGDIVVFADYFPMKAHFDFTGVIDVTGLDPGTQYTYRMGYIVADMEPEQLGKVRSDMLVDASAGEFRTADPATTDLSFVFGSCRYLLKLFNLSIFDDRGDKTFRSIREQMLAGRKTDLMLMLGDQIYADDMTTSINPDDEASEFHARYRDAFTTPHLRALMSTLPTYMAMDDHEIENNWTQDGYTSKHKLYNVAMAAYAAYQQAHGPSLVFHGDNKKLSEIPLERYYRFDHGPAGFFILDTRTERFREFEPPEMIGRQQLRELKRWLSTSTARWKFVGTSVPMFPDHRKESTDKWSGFREQRREILDYILDKQIRDVVFLSGDVHCSFWAELSHPQHPDFLVRQVVSSAFFWPFPAESRDHFQASGALDGEGPYVVASAPKYRSEDNFTRMSISAQGLDVEIFDRKGKLLTRKQW